MFNLEERTRITQLTASMRSLADVLDTTRFLEDKDVLDAQFENALEIISIQASVIQKLQTTAALMF